MTWWAAGTAVVGGLLNNNAARSAASQQSDATAAAQAQNQTQSDQARSDAAQTREDYAPYRAAGVSALGTLQSEINTPTTAADVMSDPGYQFGLSQGQLGLDRKAAASGGRVSGAALKSASEYATNYATSGYNAAYQRRQDRLNRLAALAGIGQSSTGASAMAGAGGDGLRANANLTSAQGNANAASTLAQGNIWGGALNQLGAVGQQWATGKQQGGFTPKYDSYGLNVAGY